MDDKKRKHAHQGDKPKPKRQTRSMANLAGLGSTTAERETSKATQSGKGKSVLYRLKSEGNDSAQNEFESDSEVYVSVSDSGDEYAPQADDKLNPRSKVRSKKRRAQERTWSAQESSLQSSDCVVHQLKSSLKEDTKHGDIFAHPIVSLRRLPVGKKSARITENNNNIGNSKRNRNTASSGKGNLSSSRKSNTTTPTKRKSLKRVKTWTTSTSQDATVPSGVGDKTAKRMPSASTTSISQSSTAPSNEEGILRLQTFEGVMNATWKPPSEFTQIANIRNRATFSLRHHMLLPEGHLRHSDLVNCFADMHAVPSSGGPQNVVGLALCLQYGDKVPTAKTEIAMVLRHKDYRRCPVGSVALYFFSRFHTQSEELPDFTDPEVWPKNKLLRSSTSTQAVQREVQSNLCTKLSRDLGVDTSTVQQIGRLSGNEELRSLGLNIKLPARIAPEGIDITGTVAMAGFHNRRYNIERDRVLPPKSLQRRIFPGIEDQYGWMAPAQWKAHCDRVMQSPTAFLGLEGSVGAEMRRRLDAVKESEEAYQDVAKLQLMHLLLWLRRVVLQDAALFKRDRFSSWVVKDPIFHSAEFGKFQAELLGQMAMDRRTNSIDVRDQEDSPVPYIPALDTKCDHSDHDTHSEISGRDTESELSYPNSAPSFTDTDDAKSEKLHDAASMQQETHQHQIRDLQERLDQQENLRQQQELFLQDQTVLLQNVLEQQSSLESQMKTIQTQIQNQIQTMQAELTARQDSQFSTLVVMLQGMITARSLSSDPHVWNRLRAIESANASTSPISKAVSDLTISPAPTSGRGISATDGGVAQVSSIPAPASWFT
ncbi:hypothetical protein MVEG_01442 [Podila verticillata NRRL 6337]|nr:hypothetical protein MVEG_01442 [Podila verticillata NRRL 6337]